MIHGYCKFADKGCAFRHDSPGSTTPNSKTPIKKKLNADSPSFTPSGTFSNASPSRAPANPAVAPFFPKGISNGNAKPTFNPESSTFFSPRSTQTPPQGSEAGAAGSGSGSSSGSGPGLNSAPSVSVPFLPSTSSSVPSFANHSGTFINTNGESTGSDSNGVGLMVNHQEALMSDFNNLSMGPVSSQIMPHSGVASQQEHQHLHQQHPQHTQQLIGSSGSGPPVPPPAHPPPHPSTYHAPNAHTDLIYQHHSNYPLQYHLYAPSSLGGRPSRQLLPHERTVQDFFISNNLREEMQRKNEAALQTLPSSSLPEYVHVYHSLVPLDTSFDQNDRVFGYPTWAYKAVSSSDGLTYCLRRVEGFRLTNEKAIHTIRRWNKLSSPSIVKLHEAFTTRAFGDNSLIVVYDYFPLAATLFETHFGPSNYNRGSVVEEVLWGYIVQIVVALKAMHDAGLAAGIVDPTRVILTKKGRLRLNCCGIFDIINFEFKDIDVKALQQQDFINLGRLMIALGCNSIQAALDVDKSLEEISNFYSKELYDFLRILVGTEPINDSELIQKLSTHIADGLNSSLYYDDFLDAQLSKELENGRLVRLLCKFGFINERPEFDQDSNWSETGDRYVIKLFRDYVFHQVDTNGKPVVDLGHVLMCLNKLDAGIEENIVLVSRDEKNCLIVTYKEVKACMESAFRDLSR